jgi:hypothetical protein
MPTSKERNNNNDKGTDRPEGTKYELYEPVPVPFQFQKEICQIKIENSLLLHEKNADEIRVLTGQALQKCTGVEKLCAISTTLQDRNTLCTKRVYTGESTERIKKSCNFECTSRLQGEEEQEGILPIINEIGEREYIITPPFRKDCNTTRKFNRGANEYERG